MIGRARPVVLLVDSMTTRIQMRPIATSSFVRNIPYLLYMFVISRHAYMQAMTLRTNSAISMNPTFPQKPSRFLTVGLVKKMIDSIDSRCIVLKMFGGRG